MKQYEVFSSAVAPMLGVILVSSYSPSPILNVLRKKCHDQFRLILYIYCFIGVFSIGVNINFTVYTVPVCLIFCACHCKFSAVMITDVTQHVNSYTNQAP